MKKLLAFINGVRECRLTATTYYDDVAYADAYDRGREIAHRLTFRHFDPA